MIKNQHWSIARICDNHLQSWKELGHYESWFVMAQLGCYIPSHPEIGILVNSTRYEAAQIFAFAKDVREAVGKAGRCLNCWKGNLAYVVRLCQPEYRTDHVHGH